MNQLERVVLNERIVPEIVKAINKKVQEIKNSSKAEIKEVIASLIKIEEHIDKIVEIIMNGVSVSR